MVGIYKIMSPSGKVYIGQSWNIQKRILQHRYYYTDQHIARSIKKHGFYNHAFSVVHELPLDVDQVTLTAYEQLYMDLYRDCGVIMMNSRDAGNAGKMSEETKAKISKNSKGRIVSNETKAKLSLAKKGILLSEEHKQKLKLASINKNKGRAINAEVRLKISIAKKGIKVSESTMIRLSRMRIGSTLTPEHKSKFIGSNKGSKWKNGGGNQRKAKRIIDLETGENYETLALAAKSFNINYSTLGAMLNGQNKNKTNLSYDA